MVDRFDSGTGSKNLSMNRISVTTLEKYRRVVNQVSPYDTEEALLESLKGLFTGNDKTRTGSAYHKIIEGQFDLTTLTKQKLLFYKAENVIFNQDQALPALDYKKLHLNMVHEMSTSKIYQTVFGPIQVSMRVDGIEGNNIRDIKCKFRDVNFSEYADSYQWRFYLDALQTDIFYYDLFEFQGFSYTLTEKDMILSSDTVVVAHEPFQCLRYDDMHADLVTLLNSFLDYLQIHNYQNYLKPELPTELFA